MIAGKRPPNVMSEGNFEAIKRHHLVYSQPRSLLPFPLLPLVPGNCQRGQPVFTKTAGSCRAHYRATHLK